jgi:hypothetical protein
MLKREQEGVTLSWTNAKTGTGRSDIELDEVKRRKVRRVKVYV